MFTLTLNLPPMKTPITPAISIRFGVFFGQSDTFWHGIQPALSTSAA